MAYAAAVVYLTAAAVVASDPAFWWKNYDPRQVWGLLGVTAGAAFLFVWWQLDRRQWAADMVAACMNVAARWLDAGFRDDDLKVTPLPRRRLFWRATREVNGPRAIADELDKILKERKWWRPRAPTAVTVTVMVLWTVAAGIRLWPSRGVVSPGQAPNPTALAPDLWSLGAISTTAIAAVVAFAATFSGVFLSFWLERERRRRMEQVHFGQVLRSIVTESANNMAQLENLKAIQPGGFPLHQLSTDALDLALGSALFHRLAPHSLVFASTVCRTHLGVLGNLLSHHRARAAAGHALAESPVAELRGRAETGQDYVRVLQDLLDDVMREAGSLVVADERLNAVNQQLAQVRQRETERLEALRRG